MHVSEGNEAILPHSRLSSFEATGRVLLKVYAIALGIRTLAY